MHRPRFTVSFAAFVGAIIISTGFSLAPVVAFAQDAGALSQRLERLERDIQTLSKMVVRGPGSVPSASVPSSGASASGDPLPANAVARIGVRLDAMEGELRDATGRLEELTFKLGQLTQRVDRLVADVDFRLSGLEQQLRPGGAAPAGTQPTAGAGAPGQPGSLAQGGEAPAAGTAPLPDTVQVIGQGPQTLGKIEADKVPSVAPQTAGTSVDGEALSNAAARVPAPQVAGAPSGTPTVVPQPAAVSRAQAGPRTVPSAVTQQQASLPDGSPEEQYKFAFGLLRKHQFDQAEGAFKAFLEANPKNSLAGNARYWLGETHYARAEYVKAAEVFLQGFEADPNGGKAPDSLLKLAMSLGQLGQTKEACGAIGKLFADFPNANSSLKRTATRQQRQMKCN